MICTYLVHGWFHLCMVQFDYRLFGKGWCMVDALVYGTDLIIVVGKSPCGQVDCLKEIDPNSKIENA
jgi:hypothetical protein